MDRLTRRDLLRLPGLLAAGAGYAAAVAWGSRRLSAAQGSERPVAEQPFGRLERLASGVWALVSTPLGGDRATFGNGGLIAGRDGVLAIEGFNSPQGAQWLATQSLGLTGRPPTHVVLTHFHADHVNGVAGYSAEGRTFELVATSVTRTLALERNQPADPQRSAVLKQARTISSEEPTVIDLGDRTIRLTPRAGHTPSDVTVEVDDPPLVFCGDLVWNAFFPNYVDARPSDLRRAVDSLVRLNATMYVPGHGSVSTPLDVARYVSMIREVENAARQAHSAGRPPEEAAGSFQIPASLGEWALLNRAFYQRAFEAWYRELK
jgi:glyoxylase-like metal-dependent hydrolase (beta-lactamase superfamily II)